MTLDAAHLHLMLNHVPIVGAPLLLLLLTLGLIRGSRDLTVTALGLTVGLALLTGIIFLTGEPAEDLVERAPWFQKTLVEQHEERAEASLIAVLVSGAVAAVTLIAARRRAAPWLGRLTWGSLVVSTVLLAWTAWTGGQIRHDEVRPAVAEAPHEKAG